MTKSTRDPILTAIMIRRVLLPITADNVEEVYRRQFNGYIYDNSDEVEVNGKVITDPIKKALMKLPDNDGNPNIKKAFATGIKDGFPLTELDFIKDQLLLLSEAKDEGFKSRKQLEIYLKYLKRQEKIFLDQEEKDESLKIEVQKQEAKTAKNVWNQYQRFEFLRDLGFLENIESGNTLLQVDRSIIISQILGCSIDNARKLINGTYGKGNNASEQELEREQLVSLYKNSKTK